MNSTGPISFSNSQGVSDPPSTGEQPAQTTLPDLSGAELGRDPQPTPHELHEEQIQFLSLVLDNEVKNHNKTRERLHRYLNLYMQQESEGCAGRVHTQYLNAVINNLKAQLKQEQVRRLALEEDKAALLQESFNNFTCDYPAGNEKSLDAGALDRLIFDAPIEPRQTRASSNNHDEEQGASSSDSKHLKQVFCPVDEVNNAQTLSIIQWTPSARSSPERFALDDDELSDSMQENARTRHDKRI